MTPTDYLNPILIVSLLFALSGFSLIQQLGRWARSGRVGDE